MKKPSIYRPLLTLSKPFSTLSSLLPTNLGFSKPRTGDGDPQPQSLLKEDPLDSLSRLWVRTFGSPTQALPNLTGFLKKLDLWVVAYQRSSAHVTGSFPPKNAIPANTLSSLLSLQRSILDHSFRWGMRSHLLLRSPLDPSPSTKPLSRRRFLSLLNSQTPPPFQDRVVQELLLLLLEPVFEPRFSPHSHAFRPSRSPHSALRSIRSRFAPHLWLLKADLSPLLRRLPLDLLLSSLRNATTDDNVLRLLKSALHDANHAPNNDNVDDKFLRRKKRKLRKKAGRSKKKRLNDNEPKPDPYWLRTFFGFAPEEAAALPSYGHCGILSPLLFNVCLNELDSMMEHKTQDFFRPSLLDPVGEGCHNPSWPEFVPSGGREKSRRMDYVRYGAHVLIGIRGPREDAVRVRRDLIEFCETKFRLKLDNSKVEIEHISRGIQFLDHIICRRVIHPTLHYTATGGKIVRERGVGTLLSVTANLHQCICRFRRLDLVKGNKDPEPLPCLPMLYAGQAHTNAQMNKFLETMADWYRYADNRKKVVGFCAYVIRSSIAKLYAARYRLKSRAKVYKIASRDLSHPLRESTRNNAPEYSDLLRMGLVDTIDGIQFSHMSLIPSCDYTPLPRNWVPDHERVLREYIRLQDPKFFCSLLKSVKQQGLNLPQDDLSKFVWDYKVHGVQGDRSEDKIKQVGS